MDKHYDISIITVNWNSAHQIENMLESLRLFSKGVLYEIILVDNGSETSDLLHLQKLIEKFRLIEITLKQSDENLGFGKACNIGAQISKGNYLAFINPDIIFSENTLKTLLDELKTDPKIGLVGPMLKDNEGRIVTSAMKRSSIWSIAIGKTFLPISKALGRKTSGSFYIDQSVASYPDWVYGSFMVSPSRVFKAVGGFDERYFMYAEEADLCLSIIKLGYKVRYLPTTSVIHEGEGVAKTVPELTIKRKAESEYKFFAKWNGKAYASANSLVNGLLFIIKGLFSFWRGAVSIKLIKMGVYRLRQLKC